MKIRITLGVLSLLMATLFLQCKKEDGNAVFDAQFYTSNATGELSLYIDDRYQGILPYFATAPQCGQSYGDGQRPLNVSLQAGEYRIVGKDARSREQVYGFITVGRNKMGTSGGTGGLSMSQTGDCLAIGLFD